MQTLQRNDYGGHFAKTVQLSLCKMQNFARPTGIQADFFACNFFYHARKLLGDFEMSGLESCLKNFVEFLRNFNYYEKRHFEFL